jgi:hypothetical protein
MQIIFIFMSISMSIYLISFLQQLIRQDIPSKDDDGREGRSGNEAREGKEEGLEEHGAVDVIGHDFGQVGREEEEGLFLCCMCVCELCWWWVVEGVGEGFVCVCVYVERRGAVYG